MMVRQGTNQRSSALNETEEQDMHMDMDMSIAGSMVSDADSFINVMDESYDIFTI